MRELTDHKVTPANAELTITVCDEPGAGGASHLYRVAGFNEFLNPSLLTAVEEKANRPAGVNLLFQNGPIGEVGVNGITQEALLAIVIDRLRSFQAGPYACLENELAIAYLQGAMKALHIRTANRMARGVKGTNQK